MDMAVAIYALLKGDAVLDGSKLVVKDMEQYAGEKCQMNFRFVPAGIGHTNLEIILQEPSPIILPNGHVS